MLEQPGLLNFENLRGWRFHSPTTTLLGSLLASSTFTGILLFLTTSSNFCYSFWLLLLDLFLCLCERSLASFLLHPPGIESGGFNNPLSCLAFSSPGGSRTNLSTPSPCLPHSQEKCTAASPIILTAPTLVGHFVGVDGNTSGWEHHSWVTLLVTERPVSSNSPPLSPLFTHHLRPGMFLSMPEASGRAQGWV